MTKEEFFKQSCEVMLNLKENHDVLFFVHGESHHLTLDLHVDYDEKDDVMGYGAAVIGLMLAKRRRAYGHP